MSINRASILHGPAVPEKTFSPFRTSGLTDFADISPWPSILIPPVPPCSAADEAPGSVMRINAAPQTAFQPALRIARMTDALLRLLRERERRTVTTAPPQGIAYFNV
jgi:hypothetical protein